MLGLSDHHPAPFELVAATPGDWHLLHTKSRQEKAISEALHARKIAHFLPLATVIRNYGGKKVPIELPLFPGYLFLKGSKDDAYAADRTKRVANIIAVADQQKMAWELRNIALALGNAAALDAYPYLHVGVKVEIRSGPFLGLQGIIESRTKRDRLLLQVESLGRALSLEIDGAILEVIA